MSGALLLAAGCTRADPAPDRNALDQSVARRQTVKEVMQAAVIPSSNTLFQVAVEPPKTEDDWRTLKRAAETLAGSGDLLQGESDSEHRTEEPWIEACRILVEAGRAAQQASAARDLDRIVEAGDRAYQACEQCHTKYFPAPP
jgi:hypothetical protein